MAASETVRERSVGERLPPALPTVREPGVRGSSGAEGRRKSARGSLSGTPVAAREGEGRRRQEALRRARELEQDIVSEPDPSGGGGGKGLGTFLHSSCPHGT